MLQHTLIARLADGLPLVASTDTAQTPEVEAMKQQSKAILKQLDHRSPTRMSVDSGVSTINYMIEDGVIFLVIAERTYPRKLIFSYLNDVHRCFVEELVRDHGEGWRQAIDTAARAYCFIKFDRQLQRLRKEYADPSSMANTSRLAEELSDIQTIMRRNIAEVLDRGEKLEHVSKISSRLVSESKQFKWGAKKLNLMDAWKQYAPMVIAALIFLFVIWWRFF